MNRLTQREQRAMARLSSYDGGINRPGYGMGRSAAFNGMGNSTYGGLTGASTEKEINAFQGLLTYQLTVVNGNVATRTFRLTPALLGESAPGLIQQGAFNDINGNAGLTGSTTSPGTIAQLERFITFNPTKLLALKFVSTLEEQSNVSMNLIPISPFRQLESKIVPLGQYNDGDTYNDKIVFANLIPYDVQMDMQIDIQIPVVGSSTLNLILFLGPILNPAQILDQNTRNL